MNTMKFKLFLGLLGLSVLMIIVIPIIFYTCTFGYYISDNKETWAHFGGFLNVFVSIASLLSISILTYIIYVYQREDESNKSIPILIFKVNPTTNNWVVQNVGKGAALNILVTYSKQLDKWEKPTKIYSLSDNLERELPWFKQPSQCSAVYYDYLGNVFSSICINDDTKFIKNVNHLSEFKENYLRLEDSLGNPMAY